MITPRFLIWARNSIPQERKQNGFGEEEDKQSWGQAGYRCPCEMQVGRLERQGRDNLTHSFKERAIPGQRSEADDHVVDG